MIVDWIVTALLASIDAILGLFPTWTWPTRALTSSLEFVGQANRVVPVATAAAMCGIYLAVKAGFAVFDLALWIYHQFWGSS